VNKFDKQHGEVRIKRVQLPDAAFPEGAFSAAGRNHDWSPSRLRCRAPLIFPLQCRERFRTTRLASAPYGAFRTLFNTHRLRCATRSHSVAVVFGKSPVQRPWRTLYGFSAWGFSKRQRASIVVRCVLDPVYSRDDPHRVSAAEQPSQLLPRQPIECLQLDG
jgi:hypothetical protein